MADDPLRSEAENDTVLSEEEAVQALGVPRKFFLELLNNRQIRSHRAGTQRLVLLTDVIVYRDHRDRERHEAVNQMAKAAMQAGYYDEF